MKIKSGNSNFSIMIFKMKRIKCLKDKKNEQESGCTIDVLVIFL